VRIRGYFSKPKGVREQKRLGNTDLGYIASLTKSYMELYECRNGSTRLKLKVSELFHLNFEFQHRVNYVRVVDVVIPCKGWQ
jgi:hypothetical protein